MKNIRELMERIANYKYNSEYYCKVCDKYIIGKRILYKWIDGKTPKPTGIKRLKDRLTSDDIHYHPFEWSIVFGSSDKKKIINKINKLHKGQKI